MKRRWATFGLLLLLILVLLVALAAPTSAAPTKKVEFTGTMYGGFASYDERFSPQFNVLHLDNFENTMLAASDSPYLTGSVYVYGDARALLKEGTFLGLPRRAEWTGKFVYYGADGTEWRGSFTLKNDLESQSQSVNCVGVGTAGPVEGYVLKFSGSGDLFGPLIVSGYYMEK